MFEIQKHSNFHTHSQTELSYNFPVCRVAVKLSVVNFSGSVVLTIDLISSQPKIETHLECDKIIVLQLWKFVYLNYERLFTY